MKWKKVMYLKFGVKARCTRGGAKVITQNTHPLRNKSTCLMSFDKEFFMKRWNEWEDPIEMLKTLILYERLLNEVAVEVDLETKQGPNYTFVRLN